MPSTKFDAERLRQALALAEGAIGVSEPNPRVGCVIGMEDGRILGTGATRKVGDMHAEAVALAAARAAGSVLQGATAWVTLEPCSHHGRTPPCCDALIAAGIARVVVAVEDPFPLVAGSGLARLRAAGIQVDMAGPEFAAQAVELNIGYFSRLLRKRPWVRLKVAASLDGRIALENGRSQWITGSAARTDGHAWRKRAGAVMTGLGTVLADDPRLDVRLVPTDVQPLRVVLDTSLRTPTNSRLLAPPGRTLVIGSEDAHGRAAALQAAGAEVILIETAAGRIDLHAVLTALCDRQINELHVEAGARLNASLLQLELVDELLLFQAPMLIGPGLSMAALPPSVDLNHPPRFRLVDVRRLDDDLRIVVRPVNSADPHGWHRDSAGA